VIAPQYLIFQAGEHLANSIVFASAPVREHWHGGPIMRDRCVNLAATGAITAAVGAVAALLGTQTSAQAPTDSVTTLKTPWAEPDLQGIWTNEFDMPLQRPAKYADQEFFTEAQRAELDRQLISQETETCSVALLALPSRKQVHNHREAAALAG
jgi:hypothetical protein